MIDDGKNPFEGLENVDEELDNHHGTLMDSEIESVVDDFETAEE